MGAGAGAGAAASATLVVVWAAGVAREAGDGEAGDGEARDGEDREGDGRAWPAARVPETAEVWMGAAAIKGAVGTMSSTAGVKGVGADASWACMAEDSPRSFASRPTWEDFDGVTSEVSDDESL